MVLIKGLFHPDPVYWVNVFSQWRYGCRALPLVWNGNECCFFLSKLSLTLTMVIPLLIYQWINFKWIHFILGIFLQKEAICIWIKGFWGAAESVSQWCLSVNLGPVEALKAIDKHLYLEVRCWNMICSDGAESQSPRAVFLCMYVHVHVCLLV